MWAPLPMVPWVFLALAPAPSVLAQVQLAASGPGAGRVSESVTLNCAVSGVFITERYNYWYWVRQRPGAGLESLGWIYPYDNGKTHYPPAFRGRVTISADRSANRVSLQLRSLSAADAATYYCARRPLRRALADKLIFGAGTTLTVEPENQATSPPSVFVVKSRAPKNDKVAAACLAKGFYPKEVTITMNPGTEVVYDSKEGVLSPDGKYSAVQVVKVGPEEAVKCTVIHASQNFSAEDSPSAPAAPTHLPAASPGFCESSTSSSTAEEPDLEKVNMLSLTVLGLRVLMAKSIAFNVLMTAKLFI